MKKFLLSFAVAALAFGASAQTYNVNDATDITGTLVEEVPAEGSSNGTAKHYQPLESLKLGETTFSFVLDADKGTAPAYYYNMSTSTNTQNTIRIYGNNKMTVAVPAGKVMTKVEFTGSNAGKNLTGTVDAGTWNFSGSNATWTGNANTFTLSVTAAWRIKEVTFTIVDEGTEVPDEPTALATMLAQTDAECDWTLGAENLPEGLTAVWSWKSYNGAQYLNASAYVGGTKYAVEEYAVSPVVDLTNVTDATYSFEHAAKFQTTLRELCGACIRVEGATEWTALEIPTWPEAGSWTFVNSGEISLADYVGKKVQFAFKYGSTEEGADTWEIRNLVITGKGKIDTPDKPDEPEVPTKTYTKTTTVDLGASYVLACDDKLCTAVPAASPYGRFTLAEATFTDTTVESAEANAFVIEGEEGKYTMKDASGRYLAMDDSHKTSFQMYSELQDGCYWTISFNAEGQAVIENNLSKCTVSQTKGKEGTFYTNVAPADLTDVAAEDFHLPVLYVDNSTVSIEGVEAEADVNAPVEYFNLQGVRVNNPEGGLFIMRQGSKVAKVIR